MKAVELNHPIATIEPVRRMMISLPRLIEDLHQMARHRERLDDLLRRGCCVGKDGLYTHIQDREHIDEIMLLEDL